MNPPHLSTNVPMSQYLLCSHLGIRSGVWMGKDAGKENGKVKAANARSASEL